MSAEDELSWHPANPEGAEGDAARYAEHWDDSESSAWNIRTIGWWLRQVEEADC